MDLNAIRASKELTQEWAENYHLDELRVASSLDHPAHQLPPEMGKSARILDIGCGAGQTLIAAYAGRPTFGLDRDLGALLLGRSQTQEVRFVCGQAEALPYRDQEFDLVVARVSLPYTDLRASLSEIHRVLRKGGKLWMTLHPFSLCWEQAQRANFKGWIFFGYIVVNSLLFHLLQRQFPLLGRQESFQTARGITRALTRTGFREIEIKRGEHFLVTART